MWLNVFRTGVAVIPSDGPSLKLGNAQEEPEACKAHGPWRYGLQGCLEPWAHNSCANAQWGFATSET